MAVENSRFTRVEAITETEGKSSLDLKDQAESSLDLDGQAEMVLSATGQIQGKSQADDVQAEMVLSATGQIQGKSQADVPPRMVRAETVEADEEPPRMVRAETVEADEGSASLLDVKSNADEVADQEGGMFGRNSPVTRISRAVIVALLAFASVGQAGTVSSQYETTLDNVHISDIIPVLDNPNLAKEWNARLEKQELVETKTHGTLVHQTHALPWPLKPFDVVLHCDNVPDPSHKIFTSTCYSVDDPAVPTPEGVTRFEMEKSVWRIEALPNGRTKFHLELDLPEAAAKAVPKFILDHVQKASLHDSVESLVKAVGRLHQPPAKQYVTWNPATHEVDPVVGESDVSEAEEFHWWQKLPWSRKEKKSQAEDHSPEKELDKEPQSETPSWLGHWHKTPEPQVLVDPEKGTRSYWGETYAWVNDMIKKSYDHGVTDVLYKGLGFTGHVQLPEDPTPAKKEKSEERETPYLEEIDLLE